MTRVEKYREYRKEILNSFYYEKKETKKSIVSSRVSQATLNKDTANNLTVEEVMEAYELYDESKPTEKKRTINNSQKKELLFFIVGIVVIIALIIGLVFVGINIFGGN